MATKKPNVFKARDSIPRNLERAHSIVEAVRLASGSADLDCDYLFSLESVSEMIAEALKSFNEIDPVLAGKQ